MDRRIVSGVTLLVLVAVVAAAAAWGWQRVTEPAPELFEREETPICEPVGVRVGDRVRAAQVTVSVYNGGTRAGLAARTLGLLTDRGFAEGLRGNAPDDTRVRTVQIWTDRPRNHPAVRLVAAQFRSPRILRNEPLGPGVNVVVGNEFERLRRGPRAVVSALNTEICSPPA